MRFEISILVLLVLNIIGCKNNSEYTELKSDSSINLKVDNYKHMGRGFVMVNDSFYFMIGSVIKNDNTELYKILLNLEDVSKISKSEDSPSTTIFYGDTMIQFDFREEY